LVHEFSVRYDTILMSDDVNAHGPVSRPSARAEATIVQSWLKNKPLPFNVDFSRNLLDLLSSGLPSFLKRMRESRSSTDRSGFSLRKN
jgi:hypothetical protein